MSSCKSERMLHNVTSTNRTSMHAQVPLGRVFAFFFSCACCAMLSLPYVFCYNFSCVSEGQSMTVVEHSCGFTSALVGIFCSIRRVYCWTSCHVFTDRYLTRDFVCLSVCFVLCKQYSPAGSITCYSCPSGQSCSDPSAPPTFCKVNKLLLAKCTLRHVFASCVCVLSLSLSSLFFLSLFLSPLLSSLSCSLF